MVPFSATSAIRVIRAIRGYPEPLKDRRLDSTKAAHEAYPLRLIRAKYIGIKNVFRPSAGDFVLQ